jgi:hypothetical protein
MRNVGESGVETCPYPPQSGGYGQVSTPFVAQGYVP